MQPFAGVEPTIALARDVVEFREIDGWS